MTCDKSAIGSVHKGSVISTAESIYHSHVLHCYNCLVSVTIDQKGSILHSSYCLFRRIDDSVSDVV